MPAARGVHEAARALCDSYRCDCDGKVRRLRVLSREDGAEQVASNVEAITGQRYDGCPWRAYEDPFVGEVLRAYRHWKERSLHLVWGDDPPVALIRGLEVYDAALNAIRAHDMGEDRKKREADRQKQLNERAAKKGRGRP